MKPETLVGIRAMKELVWFSDTCVPENQMLPLWKTNWLWCTKNSKLMKWKKAEKPRAVLKKGLMKYARRKLRQVEEEKAS